MPILQVERDRWERLKAERPELFEVMYGVDLGHHCYEALGNVGLLQLPMKPVHVRMLWNAEDRRNYKNWCILEGRQGTVLVGPFISTDEKQVMRVALKEGLPVVQLLVNGLPDADSLPDELMGACAEGRLLLMAPWPDRDAKLPLTRQECQTLNKMAEELAAEDWFE